MRRTMILTIEAEGERAEERIIRAQGLLMHHLYHLHHIEDTTGAGFRVTYCDEPLADTTIEKLARPKTNEPPRRNGRRLHLS